MVRKKVKKLLAITLSTVLAVSGYPIDGMAVKAQVTETKNTTEIKKCEFNTRLYNLFLDLEKQNGEDKMIQFSME